MAVFQKQVGRMFILYARHEKIFVKEKEKMANSSKKKSTIGKTIHGCSRQTRDIFLRVKDQQYVPKKRGCLFWKQPLMGYFYGSADYSFSEPSSAAVSSAAGASSAFFFFPPALRVFLAGSAAAAWVPLP